MYSPPGYQVFPALAADEDEDGDENGRDDDSHDDQGDEGGLILQRQVVKEILPVGGGVGQRREGGAEQLCQSENKTLVVAVCVVPLWSASRGRYSASHGK